MDYKVVVTADAEEDLNQYIRYLLMEKKSGQAARNVLGDFEATIHCRVALMKGKPAKENKGIHF